jgi:hypothetical protein
MDEDPLLNTLRALRPDGQQAPPVKAGPAPAATEASVNKPSVTESVGDQVEAKVQEQIQQRTGLDIGRHIPGAIREPVITGLEFLLVLSMAYVLLFAGISALGRAAKDKFKISSILALLWVLVVLLWVSNEALNATSLSAKTRSTALLVGASLFGLKLIAEAGLTLLGFLSLLRERGAEMFRGAFSAARPRGASVFAGLKGLFGAKRKEIPSPPATVAVNEVTTTPKAN